MERVPDAHLLEKSAEADLSIAVWVLDPPALPGLERLPHRDHYVLTIASSAGTEALYLERGIWPAELAGRIPTDAAQWVQAVICHDLDEARRYWRERGCRTYGLFD